jgi:methylenetetrahydrofolate reductase (NADPH)
MAVANLITKNNDEHQFSFEVLPPLKGTGTER